MPRLFYTKCPSALLAVAYGAVLLICSVYIALYYPALSDQSVRWFDKNILKRLHLIGLHQQPIAPLPTQPFL